LGREPEALGELLKERRDRAYSTALRLVGSSADAEDAVQEACVKLLSREKGFGSLEEFDVAVYRAVFQCSMDALRRRRRTAVREGKARGRAAATRTDAKPQVSEEEMRQLRAELRTAVGELPEEERGPAVLCYYQGLSEVQAAEVLEVPRSTLRRRLSRAVGSLRRQMGEDGRKLAPAALVGLMAGDALLPAPQSLCAALDAALPGRPCAEVPALPRPAAPSFVPSAAAPLKIALSVAAALICAAAIGLYLNTAKPNREVDSDRPGPTVGPGGNQELKAEAEEEEEVKKKLTGLAAATAAFALSSAAGATEPSAEVAEVIAAIKARQAAKKVAAAKDAAEKAELYNKYGPYYKQ
jgi:RNA polymerase sigma-70 factor (ECF subfamily)